VWRRRIFINEVKEEIGNIKSMEADCFFTNYTTNLKVLIKNVDQKIAKLKHLFLPTGKRAWNILVLRINIDKGLIIYLGSSASSLCEIMNDKEQGKDKTFFVTLDEWRVSIQA
jgi:hypothetical protein